MLRIGAACVGLLGACMLFNPDYYAADRATREFFRLPTHDQRDRFGKFDAETQYKLLLFGNDVMHPPALYLATEFAKQGPSLVPSLENKLRNERKEQAIRDIVLVLSEMDGLRVYSVSRDSALMDLLVRRTNEMHGAWREATLEMLAKIREGN